VLKGAAASEVLIGRMPPPSNEVKSGQFENKEEKVAPKGKWSCYWGACSNLALGELRSAYAPGAR